LRWFALTLVPARDGAGARERVVEVILVVRAVRRPTSAASHADYVQASVIEDDGAGNGMALSAGEDGFSHGDHQRLR
jgi:hypothetical protein